MLNVSSELSFNLLFEVFRADEERRAGEISKDMFQELLLADLVVATVRDIKGHGAYVRPDEYEGLGGKKFKIWTQCS